MRLILGASLMASLWTAQAFAQVDDVWVVPSYPNVAPAPVPVIIDPAGSDKWWFDIAFYVTEADNCSFISNAQMEAALNEIMVKQGSAPANMQIEMLTGSIEGKAAAEQPANCNSFSAGILDTIRQDALNWNGR